MAQTKPKAAQFYGVSGDGTAGQVLISDGNGGMSWGANTENYTVSWNTPTGQSLTYTQPTPQSSSGSPGSTFTSTTFTATKSGEEISGTATIAGLPTGITATQSLSGSGANNVLTVTLTGIFPGADSLNTALTLSGLTVAPPLTVDYLVVAGGGSGGAGYGPGGGAGGYREGNFSLVTGQAYAVTVGSGGTSNYGSGSDSVFFSITSTGGGGGREDGGSGGGGRYNNGIPGNGNTPSTSPSQGNNGGTGTLSGRYGTGGGGGAGGVGGAGSTTSPAGGVGGVGKASDIKVSGTSVYYAGGGGGGEWSGNSSNGISAAGGLGGGGIGAAKGYGNGGNGVANTGGGGGGSSDSGSIQGNGGSGVVIVRYPNAYTVTIGAGLTGPTTTDGSDKVTTFTAGTGTITFS